MSDFFLSLNVCSIPFGVNDAAGRCERFSEINCSTKIDLIVKIHSHTINIVNKYIENSKKILSR